MKTHMTTKPLEKDDHTDMVVSPKEDYHIKKRDYCRDIWTWSLIWYWIDKAYCKMALAIGYWESQEIWFSEIQDTTNIMMTWIFII